ncbi:uncharacterized protein LOC109603088 isoform X1 [Aethina tumida]|uniref:uncharacterized protein LOC109603088 isoform X1 n=1 Tax=Aethina tumida TaxID=116153 RepID=UPI0021480D39|nr:uncharacterized protein LOC109603088 isoform X1 [Aethina tumida]
MGNTTSKNNLDRRNTVLRRSQTKKNQDILKKLEKLQNDITKFKGTESDESYERLKLRLDNIRKEHQKLGQQIRPELKRNFKAEEEKLKSTEEYLVNKLQSNKEKHEAKSKKTENKTEDEAQSQVNSILSEEHKDEEQELEQTTDKRKTVELTSVRVEPIEPTNEEPTSPTIQEKRKSIFKMGIPVMNLTPELLKKQLEKRKSKVSFSDNSLENKNSNIEEQLDNIIEKMRNIELNINKFEDRKGSLAYNRVLEDLMICQTDLKQLEINPDVNTKWRDAMRYFDSLRSFLDERAVENVRNSNYYYNNRASQYKSTEQLADAISHMSEGTLV